MEKIKVVLVDDHSAIREALREVLPHYGDFEIVADYGDPQEFLSNIENFVIDVLLLDIRMPTMDGFQVAARVKKYSENIKIIMFSMYDDEESIRQALKIKVSGYVLKDSSLSEVACAIRSAYRDQLYLSPAIAKRVVEQPAQLNRLSEKLFGLELLTEREKDVLKLIAVGLRIKEIATQLHISAFTAETHKKNIMDKLDIHNVVLMTRYAIQSSLIDITKP